MIEYQLNKNRTIIRQALEQARDAYIDAENDLIDDSINYMQGKGCTDILRTAIKNRYARFIDKNEETGDWEFLTDHQTGKALDGGFYEMINSGIDRKIVKAQQIFGNPTSYMEFSAGEGDESDYTQIEAVINSYRNAGNYKLALQAADNISCCVESGPMLFYYDSGRLHYKPFSPRCLHFTYPDYVVDNGDKRAPQYDSIEDAARVVIELNTLLDTSRSDQRQYLAIYGRSEKYLLGRWVTYYANKWSDVPEVDKGGFDWRVTEGQYSGEPANPLSLLAATSDNDVGIEYPLVIFSGGNTITSDTPMPVSTALHENVLELDIALSRTLKDVLVNGRGRSIITNNSTMPLPRFTEDCVVLSQGQTFHFQPGDGASNIAALEVTKNIARAFAEGRSVPGYQLFMESGGQPEAGIALYLKLQPLREHWDHRAEVNQSNMDRLWEIERRLLEVHKGEALTAPEVRQIWHPGRFVYPESFTDKYNRLWLAFKDGNMSYPRFVMELYDLPTIAAAKARIDKDKELQEEEGGKYAGPKPQQAQTTNPFGTAGLSPRPPRNFG